jgi:hypothetical protein
MSLFTIPEEGPFVFGAYAAHVSEVRSATWAGEPEDPPVSTPAEIVVDEGELTVPR